MSFGAKQQQKRKMGALVPVSRPAVATHSYAQGSFDHGMAQDNLANGRLTPARSAFLVQLTRQYETKVEAVKRREETRHTAGQRYGKRPLKTNMRHLVWA